MLSCSVAVNAHAMGNGFYMGFMMGPATNNAPTLQALVYDTSNPNFPNGASGFTTTPADPRHNQFAARLFMGNQFNQYAAIEWGGTFISSVRYDAHGVKTYGSMDQRVRDLDIVGKGIFPIGSFSLYAKLGMAVAYVTTGGAFNPEFIPLNPQDNVSTPRVTASTTYKNKFAPTYSIGASYDIDQSWMTDLSMNVLQIGNNIGNLTYFAIGISYHFTSKYCGQFLCDD